MNEVNKADRFRQTKPLKIDAPDNIGKYELRECIGRGTCGVVHKGYDPVISRDVAIKISPSENASKVNRKKLPPMQRAFLTEAKAASRLKHINIVDVYDAGEEGEFNFLVMEFIEGHSLKKHCKGGELLPVEVCLQIIIDCCSALEYSHAQKIIHRDIKPSNIMLTSNQQVKLLDFGIAVSANHKNSRKKGPSLGTPNYMSPEQILGIEVGVGSDLYSLATVLFEMLTGQQLFKGESIKELFQKTVKEPIPILLDVNPDLPVFLSDIIERALKKDPDDRYHSASEFSAELKKALQRVKSENNSNSKVSGADECTHHRFVNEADITHLTQGCATYNFQPGSVIQKEGELDEHFYILASGEVSVRRNGDLVEVLTAGDSFGELGFIHSGRNLDTIEAINNVAVFKIDADSFELIPAEVQLQFYKEFSTKLAGLLLSNQVTGLDFCLGS